MPQPRIPLRIFAALALLAGVATAVRADSPADSVVTPPPRDTLAIPPAPADTGAAPAMPHDTLAIVPPGMRGVRDTVTVLPPVRVDAQGVIHSEHGTRTSIRLERAAVVRYLPATVGEALAQVPGVELVKTGPWASRVALRGLSGDRVLMLVDGVKLNTSRGHGVQPSLVSLDRVDAIEVLPGASSAQYGSDALGGVIQIVTHRSLFSQTPVTDGSIALRGTEPGDGFGQQLRARMRRSRFGVEVSGGWSWLDALVVPEGRVPNSGYRDDNVSVRGAARIGSATLDAEHVRQTAHDVGLPAFGVTPGSSGLYPLQGREANRFEVAFDPSRLARDARVLAVVQTLRTDFTETTTDSTYVRGRLFGTTTTAAKDRITMRSVSVQPGVELGIPGLRVSGEYHRETAAGPRESDLATTRLGGGTPTTTWAEAYGEACPPAWTEGWASALQARATRRLLRLDVGVRYDALETHADSTATSSTSELDVRDSHWSAESGIAFALHPLMPYAHVASGFRAPNLDERYYSDDIHGGLRLYGNPDLLPERSVSYEAGLRTPESSDGWLTSARLSVYRSNVEDLITFKYITTVNLQPRFQYVNARRARIEGIEWTSRMRWGAWWTGLDAAFPRGKDLDTGERIPDVGTAKVTFDLGIPVPVARGTLGVLVRWNDALKAAEPTLARPAFWTTAVEGATTLGQTRVVVAVRNLLNTSYREPLSFIPEPSRSVAISVRRDFTALGWGK